MANEGPGAKGVQVTVKRVVPERLAPPDYAGFVWATQVGPEVQLDFCTIDFAELHAQTKERKSPDEGVTVDTKVFHSIVIPEDAARVLHDTLTRAIESWDRRRGGESK